MSPSAASIAVRLPPYLNPSNSCLGILHPRRSSRLTARNALSLKGSGTWFCYEGKYKGRKRVGHICVHQWG
jgi:hypothetical protein